MIDRQIFFNTVREDLFGGSISQQQVDGMNAILTCWDTFRDGGDLRFLAYMLATTKHETASTMYPIAEYGKGQGHEYGETDPETGQAYYGRGFVQLTWRDNYARADAEIMDNFGIQPGMEAEADNALVPKYAAAVMFLGMEEGWFRGDDSGRKNLERYFNDDVDDAYMARDIINGDISKNGKMIAGYHDAFLAALEKAYRPGVVTEPGDPNAPEHMPKPDEEPKTVYIVIEAEVPEGVAVNLTINGKAIQWH